MRRRSLIVLLSVAAMTLATIAPAVAADVEVVTPSEIEITIDPSGSVHVIDHVFDVIIGHLDGDIFLQITLTNGPVFISGSARSGFTIVHPDGGGGGICVPPCNMVP